MVAAMTMAPWWLADGGLWLRSRPSTGHKEEFDLACSLSEAALGEFIESAIGICTAARACDKTESPFTFEPHEEAKAKLGAMFRSVSISATQLPVVFLVGRAVVAFAKLQSMAAAGLRDSLAPNTDQVWPSVATNISNHRSFIRSAEDDATAASRPRQRGGNGVIQIKAKRCIGSWPGCDAAGGCTNRGGCRGPLMPTAEFRQVQSQDDVPRIMWEGMDLAHSWFSVQRAIQASHQWSHHFIELATAIKAALTSAQARLL